MKLNATVAKTTIAGSMNGLHSSVFSIQNLLKLLPIFATLAASIVHLKPFWYITHFPTGNMTFSFDIIVSIRSNRII